MATVRRDNGPIFLWPQLVFPSKFTRKRPWRHNSRLGGAPGRRVLPGFYTGFFFRPRSGVMSYLVIH